MPSVGLYVLRVARGLDRRADAVEISEVVNSADIQPGLGESLKPSHADELFKGSGEGASGGDRRPAGEVLEARTDDQCSR